MAPEQAEGRKVLTTAVDVHALGAILYEVPHRPAALLAGAPLRHVRDAAAGGLPGAAAAAPAAAGGAPRDLEAICLKCLRKDPRQRYGSAEEVAQELESFLEGRPTHVRRGPAWERAWKWSRRQPALAALVVVFTVALLGTAAGGHLVQRPRGDRTGGVTPQPLRRGHEFGLAGLDGGARRTGPRPILGHRPGPGEEDLRGFEWYYLWRLCHHDRTLRGHAGPVFAVAFSSDKKTLASASGDGTVRLWDVPGGKETGVLRGHEGMVVSVAFGPAGGMLATASEDKTVKLWKTGRRYVPGRVNLA